MTTRKITKTTKRKHFTSQSWRYCTVVVENPLFKLARVSFSVQNSISEAEHCWDPRSCQRWDLTAFSTRWASSVSTRGYSVASLSSTQPFSVGSITTPRLVRSSVRRSEISQLCLQVFIFESPDHRCSDTLLDSYQTETSANWGDMLPWIPRLKGYPRWRQLPLS